MLWLVTMCCLQAGPGKLPAKVPEQADLALPTGKTPTDWDGTYGGTPDEQCGQEDGVLFDAKGPDVQTITARTAYYTSGPRCPSTCAFPAPVVVKNGVLQVPFVWVDYEAPVEGNNEPEVKLRRTRAEIALKEQTPAQNTNKAHPHYGVRKTDAPHGFLAGALDLHFAPRRLSTGGATYIDDTSHLQLVVTGVNVKKSPAGNGRVLLFDVWVDSGNTWLDKSRGTCSVEMHRSDFKLADPDDDDAPVSQTPRHDQGTPKPNRKCIAACKSEGGECRKDCHGQSAKCASNCNRDERDCIDGC